MSEWVRVDNTEKQGRGRLLFDCVCVTNTAGHSRCVSIARNLVKLFNGHENFRIMRDDKKLLFKPDISGNFKLRGSVMQKRFNLTLLMAEMRILNGRYHAEWSDADGGLVVDFNRKIGGN